MRVAALYDIHGNLPALEAVLARIAGELTPEETELVGSWPRTVRLDIDGLGRVSFCHATPASDDEVFTRRTPGTSLLPVFEQVDADLVVCGHTHMQFDRRIGHVRVVNAGSVGMPFGEPGAYWLMLGPGIGLRRTAYDLEDAADRIRSTGCPRAREIAENEVLRSPSEEEALEVFERAADRRAQEEELRREARGGAGPRD